MRVCVCVCELLYFTKAIFCLSKLCFGTFPVQWSTTYPPTSAMTSTQTTDHFFLFYCYRLQGAYSLIDLPSKTFSMIQDIFCFCFSFAKIVIGKRIISCLFGSIKMFKYLSLKNSDNWSCDGLVTLIVFCGMGRDSNISFVLYKVYAVRKVQVIELYCQWI